MLVTSSFIETARSYQGITVGRISLFSLGISWEGTCIYFIIIKTVIEGDDKVL